MQWAGLMAGLLLFSACSEEDKKEDAVDFDQTELLTNISEGLILPGYAELNQQATALESALQAFAEAPTEAGLAEARTQLAVTQDAWQAVTLYEFGPAETVALQENINTFPPRFTELEAKIQEGSWDLSSLYAIHYKGLPALDYLLYNGEDAAVLAAFSSDAQAAKRKAFLLDVAADLTTHIGQVYNAWNPAGEDYISSFRTNTGTNAGSSLSLMVNALVKSYEELKNLKVGTPAGKKSYDGQPIPKAVEAFYSGRSKTLALLHLQAVENTFRGLSNGSDGSGLDDYLDAYYDAGAIDTDLSAEILQGFAQARTSLSAVPDPLAQAVTQNPELVEQAYNDLQAVVVLLKTDMVSTLGILISYTDNDGD